MLPYRFLSTLFMSFVFSVLCSNVHAGTIMRIKGKKARVKMQSVEFSKGERVYIFDGNDEKVGTAKVYKIKGSKAYIKKFSGKMDRGYLVSSEPFSTSATKTNKASLKIFLGLAFLDIDSTPLVFGADYRYKLSSFLKGWTFIGGLQYWTTDLNGFAFSILEVAGGLEKTIYSMGKINFDIGARLGFAQTEYTVATAFFGSETTVNGNLFIAPQAAITYPVGNNIRVGGELRLPYYLSESFDFLDVIYGLGTFEYRF